MSKTHRQRTMKKLQNHITNLKEENARRTDVLQSYKKEHTPDVVQQMKNELVALRLEVTSVKEENGALKALLG